MEGPCFVSHKIKGSIPLQYLNVGEGLTPLRVVVHDSMQVRYEKAYGRA